MQKFNPERVFGGLERLLLLGRIDYEGGGGGYFTFNLSYNSEMYALI